MKGRTAVPILLTVAGVALFSGCGFGLSPLGKDGSARTAVSLTLSSLGVDAVGNVSRAVMPGTDFLYIRTIGKPGKTDGALYGPYTVDAGSKFVTTDIPSGEYERIFVLCSGKDLESDGASYPFFGGAYTFHELMALPDDQMKVFISDETEKSSLDSLLDGQVSFGEQADVKISQGKENILSFTLIPITSRGYELELGKTQAYTFSSSTRARHFYRLGGIQVTPPVSSGNLSCRIAAESASSATLSAVAFFSSTGAELPTTRSGTDLPSGLTWTIEPETINAIADTHGSVELYQYLDYSGVISAEYRNTAGGVHISFDGDPTASFQNHRILLAIYGSDAAAAAASGLPWENITALAYAIVPLDASGDGSSMLPVSVTPGATYYVSAQVDTGDHYASLASLDSVDIATIVPYRGDFVTTGTGLLPFTGGQTVSLTTSGFVPYTDYVFFVAQDGNAAADGSTVANRTTLDHALSLASLLSSSESAQIYLIGSIIGQGTMDIQRNTFISAYGSAARAIASFNSSIGAIPYVRINAGGSLTLEKVSIDCSLLTGNPDSLIYMANGANCSLRMGYGSSLIGGSGYTGPTYGGGVYVGSGCDLTMQGSLIQQCTIYPMTGSYGAAVYVATGGTATLQNATFANNSTGGVGLGIVYVDGTVYAGSVTFVGNTGADHLGGGSWNPLP